MYQDMTGYRNASGCPDPTAHRAMAHADAEREALRRMADLRGIIFALAKHDGIWVDISMTDKRTGARLDGGPR